MTVDGTGYWHVDGTLDLAEPLAGRPSLPVYAPAMGRVVGLAVSAAVLALVGVVLAGDVWGVSTRLEAEVTRWWSAPIRRLFRRGVWTNPRPFGVILIVVAVLFVVAIFLGNTS